MHLIIPANLDGLAAYLLPFIDLVGRDRWFKRFAPDIEQRRSPYRWKILIDYHWLEMAISFQAGVLDKGA